MGWESWIREGREVEPSLYAADFTRLGEQIEVAARGGLPDLPLRRRRRPLRAAGDDRPCRAPLDRADDPRGRRRGRLPPDGRAIRLTTSPSSPNPAPTRSPSTSRRPLTQRGSAPQRERTASRSASPSTPAPSRRAAALRSRGRGGDDPLHEHRAGLLGPAVHARGLRADRGARAPRRRARSRSTVASERRTSRRCAPPGRSLLVAGNAVFADPDPAAAYTRIRAAAA